MTAERFDIGLVWDVEPDVEVFLNVSGKVARYQDWSQDTIELEDIEIRNRRGTRLPPLVEQKLKDSEPFLSCRRSYRRTRPS